MSHEHRRQVIEAPLGIRTIGGHTWGGVVSQHASMGHINGAHPTHRYAGKYDSDGRSGYEGGE